jgi:hypothetical protein
VADHVCFGSEFVELSGCVAGVDADGVGWQLYGVFEALGGDWALGADGLGLS